VDATPEARSWTTQRDADDDDRDLHRAGGAQGDRLRVAPDSP
jgi:hypothetical protein